MSGRIYSAVLWFLYSVIIGLLPLGFGYVISFLFPTVKFNASDAIAQGVVLTICFAIMGEALGDLLSERTPYFQNSTFNGFYKGVVGFGCILVIIGTLTGIVGVASSNTPLPTNMATYSYIMFGITLVAGIASKLKEK